MSIQTLKIDLATYETEKAIAQKELDNFEYEISESEWDDILNECSDDICIGDLSFTPSEIIKNCDPTAYRCGKSDYESTFDLDDLEEYNELKEKIADLEIEIEAIEEKIFELENEQ